MSRPPIDPLPIPDDNIERDRQVTLTVHLPTYGTQCQALDLVDRVENELRVYLHRPDLRVINVLIDGKLVRLTSAEVTKTQQSEIDVVTQKLNNARWNVYLKPDEVLGR
jgi:hypothetical protein